MIASFSYTMAEKVSRCIYCMYVYHESIHYIDYQYTYTC